MATSSIDDHAWRQRARDHFLQSAEVKQRTMTNCLDAVLQAAHILVQTYQHGGKVLLCGNGGSAADCQHMATELVGHLQRGVIRPGLPAIALTTDTSFLTAYANDHDFEGVFRRQVQALGKPGDTLIAISTSGESPNVLRAVEAARETGMSIIALTGSRGSLGALADAAILIPSTDTQYIQEAHLAVEHILCEMVEAWFTASLAQQTASGAASRGHPQ